jgi:hypothetical protein
VTAMTEERVFNIWMSAALILGGILLLIVVLTWLRCAYPTSTASELAPSDGAPAARAAVEARRRTDRPDVTDASDPCKGRRRGCRAWRSGPWHTSATNWHEATWPLGWIQPRNWLRSAFAAASPARSRGRARMCVSEEA